MSNEIEPRAEANVARRQDALLDSGVLVTRETIEHAVKMIALSCCRGERQVDLVNELLDKGLITKNLRPVPGFHWQRGTSTALAYGAVSLGGESFSNLKKRMIKAGFTFVMINNAYGPDQTELGYLRVYWGVTEGKSIVEQV